jgi:regulator of protease activity HflC (stomatin/prohibitin superfamily)
MTDAHHGLQALTDAELDLVAGGRVPIFTSPALRDAVARERQAQAEANRAEGGFQAGATVAESEANHARLHPHP